ncbi:hypothetical protein [Methylophilus aquaticus]|uniref:DUF2845 domain-containing protein n=1 Tax=Methylophilus aquaticus TaxID=1971610 RepID=A0ABT9JRG2_9PROT|nr:hypothetical protein [Methylophilus aquaticus]MDP8567147.1 hypothetical protein [Methylophilus aquaticus]
MKFYQRCLRASLVGILSLGLSSLAMAGKTYGESEFIDSFSGKSKKVVEEKLGKPVRKQQSVKPTNASNMIAGMGQQEKNSKPVQVEMWYYKNLVKYDKKNTYKETEVTFVNDRVMNIGFFNNR